MAIAVDRKDAGQPLGLVRTFAQLELDTRLLGMVGALVVIWFGFELWTRLETGGNGLLGGTFLTARNLWNLTVQTTVVGIVATGMVLVIVTRNIDLSVGSMLGFIGMATAWAQAEFLPQFLPHGHPLIWVAAVLLALVLGALIGSAQGAVTAYARVPSFIVTLGGLLIFRGAAWWVTSGRTIAPLDPTFLIFGGGITGSIGGLWTWIVGIAAIVLFIGAQLLDRARRRHHGFTIKPIWAEFAAIAIVVVAVIGFVLIMNSYYLPPRNAAAMAAAQGIPVPEGGLLIPMGIPVPVLILLAVAAIMTFIARRTRFGRYIFAIGGNPEAALLAGVNTRRIVMMVFGLIGLVTGVAAVVLTARLTSGGNSAGLLLELYAIAAAVVGGTSLGGGVGTIAGALLGALVMQSLQSGMGLLSLETTLQNMVIGIVLIFAVWLDSLYRRRRK